MKERIGLIPVRPTEVDPQLEAIYGSAHLTVGAERDDVLAAAYHLWDKAATGEGRLSVGSLLLGRVVHLEEAHTFSDRFASVLMKGGDFPGLLAGAAVVADYEATHRTR